jgi:uncharacterized membrane protein YkoI
MWVKESRILNKKRNAGVNRYMHMRKVVLSLVGSVTVVALTATTNSGAEDSQDVFKKQVRVTEAQARSIALAKVVKGTVKSSELEREHRKLIWSFDIATPNTRNITEVQVDAKTGKIVATQIETPTKQVKEAQSEK